MEMCNSNPGPHKKIVCEGGRSRTVQVAQLAVFLMFLLSIAIWQIFGHGSNLVERMEGILHTHPTLAPILFIAGHILAAAAFLPCSPFTVLAGIIWPQSLALPLSIVATLSASCTTFMIGRYFQPTILRSKLESTQIQRILAFTSRHGWRSVAFAFLNPIFPSATLGYAFGMSSISFRTYVWSALVAMLPLQVALVAMGGAVRQALIFKVWLTSGALVAVALFGFGVWMLFKRAGRAINAEEKNDEIQR